MWVEHPLGGTCTVDVPPMCVGTHYIALQEEITMGMSHYITLQVGFHMTVWAESHKSPSHHDMAMTRMSCT